MDRIPLFFEALRRPVLAARLVIDMYTFARKTAAHQRCSVVASFARGLQMLGRRYMPDEAFALGLLNPALPLEEADRFVSRSRFSQVQRSLNPIAWEPLLRNKTIFYRYCRAHNLPIPELYAIYIKGTHGWCWNGRVLGTREAWVDFLDGIEGPLVVKPSLGVYGDAIRFFEKNCRGFIESTGRKVTSADLVEHMESHREYPSFVVQERLCGHPELVRLSGTEALQTLRVLTFVESSGQVRIMHAMLKPVVGKNLIDNHHAGRTGNLLASMSLDTGRLQGGATETLTGAGMVEVAQHPDTGVRFEGFQVPYWQEALALAREAAAVFLPVRVIGWDIAITADGPRVIEGNIWCDPPNESHNMDRIVAAMEKDTRVVLTARRCKTVEEFVYL